jgi:hypothetical protein
MFPIVMLSLTLACSSDKPADDTGGGGDDTGGGDTGAYETCEQVVDAFWEETAEIRSCTEAAECGQVLTGTSCGCTQNWIARLDTDTTEFYGLIETANLMSCELIPDSDCSCPAVYGYACDAGTCQWEYDSPLPACRASDGDAYALTSVTLSGDTLSLTMSASGGCKKHDLEICWPDPTFTEGEPASTSLELYHDANGDPCEAIITETLDVDLVPLRAAWQATFQESSGAVVINVGPYALKYSF